MSFFRRFLPLMVVFLFAACGPSATGGSHPQTLYIQDKGSDTLVNLALAWAEKYQIEHPDVSISVTGGGTGTGIAALLNQTTDIANASRQMQAVELQQARTNGVDPVEFIVARDAIAVAVNPANPVSRLTFQQISDIYSGKINNWSQVGGQDRPIVRLSREGRSLTHQVHDIDTAQDQDVARLKLQTMGLGVDTLTPEQVKYASDYSAGT